MLALTRVAWPPQTGFAMITATAPGQRGVCVEAATFHLGRAGCHPYYFHNRLIHRRSIV